VWRAQSGFVQALPIEVLAEAPGGVDVRARAQRLLRFCAEPAVPLVLWRCLERAQEAGQEHLVVRRGSRAPAYADAPLNQVGIKRSPVIGLPGPHREAIRCRDAGDAQLRV